MHKNEYTLITGATGFIGSKVAERLMNDTFTDVVAVVRRAGNYKNTDWLKKMGVRLVEGNFYSPEVVRSVFSKYPVKKVIHLAALRGAGAGRNSDYQRVNVDGTGLLLEYARQNAVDRFIFCSSVGVHGTIPPKLPAGPEAALCGDSRYHQSKIRAEELVFSYIEKGLNACIVRPTITYGAGDNGFPSTLIRLVENKRLFIPAHDVWVHLLDVDTLADIFLRLLTRTDLEQRVFIAADKHPVLLKELTDLIYENRFGRQYPSFMKLPGIVFSGLGVLCRLAGSEKWYTRVRLISESRYYDITDTVNVMKIEPAETRSAFLKTQTGADPSRG